ncbi:alpha/beta hydrolase-fold protein [Lentzea sp. NBC_00516]|uniref:alpha/beta hydrolase n=1 Tax=Lentzea sp. NBC_00516 TaxID=2903582 RepID=UPI002E80ED0E|nr:alpha/beta hydrolase-fold protein [Lentzea sp. NBC_00516]WUD24675.1 alpha/beta hydrolase-fold protein [Lentzea sp. NBC_00516]
MLSPLDLSLINGPIPKAATVAAALALTYLAIRKNRTWWVRVLPIVVLACALVVTGLTLVINDVWKPWPEPMPIILMVWLGAALVAVSLAVARLRPSRWYGRVFTVVAAVVVISSALTATNAHYGLYPTSRAALEVFHNPSVDLPDSVPVADVLDLPAGKKLADVWTGAGVPDKGTLSEIEIPGAMKTRPAWIYLPPAYAAKPRPRLPVLVLLAGQPGSPRDWYDAGRISDNMDEFARAHQGLAPIVVMPDSIGSLTANPLCLDSKLGQAETYLTRDVPKWIKERLTVDERREAWTVAGLSHGGTCSLQLAVRAPDVYGNFIDLSGQREPTLGTRAETVKAAFGGDEAAFVRVNPLDILAKHQFPQLSGVIVAGKDDGQYRPAGIEVYEACRRAGMDVQWKELPGGHDWNVWRPGLYGTLPWLAQRTGLVR